MKYVYIGKYLNTYALKGEIKVSVDTDFIKERYQKGSTVYLKKDNTYTPYTVERYRLYKGNLIVKFEDIDDINDIEHLKGAMIYKSSQDIKPLGDGNYYFSDIIGLDVYTDRKIGQVIAIESGAAYNFMRIKKDDGESTLVPFIKRFIKKVDLDENKIYIDVIEGLV